MSEITLRFRQNAQSGKRELVVHYESEDDVLAHEHESGHRAFIEDLIGQSLDDTDIIIERLAKVPQAPSEAQRADTMEEANLKNKTPS